MFCKSCIDANIESRKRKCPLDRKNFGRDDVKKIYWNDGDESQ
jgi:E3 ubiquitin-protein ligase BRE1